MGKHRPRAFAFLRPPSDSWMAFKGVRGEAQCYPAWIGVHDYGTSALSCQDERRGHVRIVPLRRMAVDRARPHSRSGPACTTVAGLPRRNRDRVVVASSVESDDYLDSTNTLGNPTGNSTLSVTGGPAVHDHAVRQRTWLDDS
jgi:hypothetical protein